VSEDARRGKEEVHGQKSAIVAPKKRWGVHRTGSETLLWGPAAPWGKKKNGRGFESQLMGGNSVADQA